MLFTTRGAPGVPQPAQCGPPPKLFRQTFSLEIEAFTPWETHVFFLGGGGMIFWGKGFLLMLKPSFEI